MNIDLDFPHKSVIQFAEYTSMFGETRKMSLSQVQGYLWPFRETLYGITKSYMFKKPIRHTIPVSKFHKETFLILSRRHSCHQQYQHGDNANFLGGRNTSAA
jgi:hypothetical protein